MNRVSIARLTLHGLALGCATLAGCLDEACDPGFASHRGACYPVAVDSGLVVAPADGHEEDGGTDEAPACAPGEGFGVVCTDEDDCACGTHCIPVLKFCSVLNCASTPEVCPEDWDCRDVSAVSTDPSVSSICLAPP